MPDETSSQIRFPLTGPPLRQVILWQREVDLLVIRHQIETRGSAVAVIYEGKTRLHSLKQVPPLGQSIPWYGDFGGGYKFTFRPIDEGYRLKVEMTLAGHEFFCDDAIAPLELAVSEKVSIEPATGDRLWWGFDWGWWCSTAGETTIEELTFVLNSEMYSKMEAWGWDRGRWQTYEYGFIPLSVGCEMYVRDTLSNVEEHLTKDVCW
jgi:hypothetical protein